MTRRPSWVEVTELTDHQQRVRHALVLGIVIGNVITILALAVFGWVVTR